MTNTSNDWFIKIDEGYALLVLLLVCSGRPVAALLIFLWTVEWKT